MITAHFRGNVPQIKHSCSTVNRITRLLHLNTVLFGSRFYFTQLTTGGATAHLGNIFPSTPHLYDNAYPGRRFGTDPASSENSRTRKSNFGAHLSSSSYLPAIQRRVLFEIRP